MKKLLIIICVLVLIIIGMYFYKSNINNKNVSALEVEQIEEYLDKLYLWKEVTGEALPTFKNINDAPDIWIWEVVKQSFEDYELTYEQIQERAVEIFGKNLTKQFPTEGTDFIYYNEEEGKYITSGMGLDTKEDSFLIKKINKTTKGYDVEIVEYLVDYEEEMLSYAEQEPVETQEELETLDVEYDIYIKNLNEDIIATLKNTTEESDIIETVKSNIDKFSTKNIYIIKNKENLYVKNVE